MGGRTVERVGTMGDGDATVRILPAIFSSLAVPMIMLLRRALNEARTERGEQAALQVNSATVGLL